MTLWIILIAIPMLFGLYAQFRVRSAYSKNVQIPSRGGSPDAEAAAAVMESAGIRDVEIVEVAGELSDHYDPSHKRLALSSQNFRGTSLAALGVAAHEAGHAIQHKVGYSLMTLRQTLWSGDADLRGAAQFLIIIGIVIGAQGLGGIFLTLGAVALAVICLFQLVTLPVEFDASSRAKANS
jgi:Zn-dependent membrane protease YugP